jgi:hypothetical protein
MKRKCYLMKTKMWQLWVSGGTDCYWSKSDTLKTKDHSSSILSTEELVSTTPQHFYIFEKLIYP